MKRVLRIGVVVLFLLGLANAGGADCLYWFCMNDNTPNAQCPEAVCGYDCTGYQLAYDCVVKCDMHHTSCWCNYVSLCYQI